MWVTGQDGTGHNGWPATVLSTSKLKKIPIEKRYRKLYALRQDF